jgi:mono/diheme cytochrome c family protein
MRRLLIPIALLLASLTAVAAGSSHHHQSDDRGVWVEIARAPMKTRSWKNPYEGQADGIAAGEKLFHQHCAECHGDDAKGAHGPNLRSPGVQNATPGELAWLLWNGNLAHGMPPWAGIPEERRWQIVAYLKSLGPVEGPATSANASNIHSASTEELHQ